MNSFYKKKRFYIRKTNGNDILLLKKKRGTEYIVIAILYRNPNSTTIMPEIKQILNYRKDDLKAFRSKEDAIAYTVLEIL